MNKYQKVSEIYEKYADKFHTGFHNLLWQVIVNEKQKIDGETAFAVNLTEIGPSLVIVHHGQKGFIQTACYMDFNTVKTYRQSFEIAIKLNTDVFGLSQSDSLKIIGSSFKSSQKH